MSSNLPCENPDCGARCDGQGMTHAVEALPEPGYLKQPSAAATPVTTGLMDILRIMDGMKAWVASRRPDINERLGNDLRR